MAIIPEFTDTSRRHPVSNPSESQHEKFTDEIAEQRLQEKMQESGRVPENEGKVAENFVAKEKPDMTDFPKRE